MFVSESFEKIDVCSRVYRLFFARYSLFYDFIVDFEKRRHHLIHHNKSVYPCFDLDGKVFRPCHKIFRRLPLVLYVYGLHDFRVMNSLNRLNKGLNEIRRCCSLTLQH